MYRRKMLLPLKHALVLSLATASVFSISPVLAQQAIDAGALRQQIEQTREQPLPPVSPAPATVAPPAEMKVAAGITVTVNAFQFAGNTLLTEAQLAPSVADFLNRPLSFNDLQRAADAVAATYRQAGWIVRVYLPEQDVSAGSITLQIMEARFGGLRFNSEAASSGASRIDQALIEKYIHARQRIGEPLAAPELDRAILLANDLPGVSVSGTLVPGESEGETALLLKPKDTALINGDLGLDNTGARATGRTRFTTNFYLNNFIGHGEQLSANLIHSSGSDYLRAAFVTPVGYDGLRLIFSASDLSYRVVEGTGSSDLGRIRGSSSSFGAGFSYPMLRAYQTNLYVSGGIENKSYDNRDIEVHSDYQTNTVHFALTGNRFDTWGGGGANNASVQVLWGQLANMNVHPLDASIKRNYHKIKYNFSRLQNLTAEQSLFVSLSGQYANQVLDSSENFYLGGINTVRAYPVAEFGGEQATLLTTEWQWNFAPNFLFTTFVDWGQVVALSSNPGERDTTLRAHGHGLSLSWQAPHGFYTKLTWSHRSGNNPRPTFSGSDSDGTLIKNRVWLSVNWRY